jgi:methylenetetrahydrofolate dehydrogenase (NADP+)/methenyltetrahydrofolate cyclohydrolase
MIVDGKKISEEVVERLLVERKTLPAELRLGVLMGAEDAASASFVKIKERVAEKLHVPMMRELLGAHATTADALSALERLVRACTGVIVQMPLPPQVKLAEILAALPPEKDVDAITEKYQGRSLLRAPVAEAVSEVFARADVSARGKVAVVVGAGKLVGAPVAELLKELGAQVSIITRNEGSLTNLKNADIIVLGAGEPGLIKPEMLKEGVVLIDAGTSEAVGGKLAGDASPECAEVASVFTPVPGGIGPIAVAMIFKNLFALAKLSDSKN